MKGAEPPDLLRRKLRLPGKESVCDLSGCLISKGQHQHILQRYLLLPVEVQDLGNEHCGFPAAYIGVYHTGRTFIQNCLLLVCIQFFPVLIPFYLHISASVFL